ncbi:heme-binding protein [Mycolicibacterium palauense]|uniref:heme-binding protein n=1 Tax=Mycolicibacterium palauense TaxID=2034511 RepID=UPI000BFEB541|nr:heme-binding protein [Mycolicibacterium palauense]
MMLTARRAIVGALGAGAVAGAMFVAAPSALAAPPPNCSAADLAGVLSGVSASTSAYLFTHPDVNAFYSGLEGADHQTRQTEITKYLDANPQVKAELTAIRQPLIDIKNNCGGIDVGAGDLTS